MVPDRRAGPRGTLLATVDTGATRRRDEESSESLGVVRRTPGSGRRFGTCRGVRRGVRRAATRRRPPPPRAAGHDPARHARPGRRRRDRRRPAHRRVVVRVRGVRQRLRQGAHDQDRALRRRRPGHRGRRRRRAWSSPTAAGPCTSRSPPPSRSSSSTARPSSRCAGSPCGRCPSCSGLLAGSGSMGAWRTFLLWVNREPFGIKDPQFGLDVGFFVFTLPWLRFVVSFVTVVLVLAFVAAAFTHYVYGGLQLPGRGPTTRAAFVHLGILGALIALTRAASYWLDRYSLSTQKGEPAHRHHLHRRQRGAAHEGDPRGRRRHVRRLLPRRDLEPQLAAAGHRRRPARRHRRGRRGHLPGADPAA